MLTPPDLAAEAIIVQLRAEYGLSARRVEFLPIGADVNTAVYRVVAEDGVAWFLKLRSGAFDEVVVAVPALLHAQGIRQVIAPLPTRDGRLWTSAHGFAWMLAPFMEGKDASEVALSPAQWIALGQALRAIHSATLPDDLRARIPREDYAPRWRDAVLEFTRQVETRDWDDPTARRLADFWKMKRHEIRAMVERAGKLAETLRGRAYTFALCHGDLHPWNILVGADGAFAIVDWDTLLYAPKEHDLMCLGGGITQIWSDSQEEALFYQGYGAVEIDPVALAYFRYERIIADLAAYGAEILEARAGAEDRERGLRQVIGQFLPNETVDVAHRTYQRLP